MSFTANSKGGLYKAPLEVENIPDHRHDQFQHYDGQADTSTSYICNSAVWSYAAKESYSTGDITNKETTTPHSNIQPYIGVYMWRRVS
jgi:microcystin-dependent protein